MKRRENGEGNINKLKDGTYKINVRYHGTRKSFYGRTEREVKEKFKKFQAACYFGLNPTDYTVSEAIEIWLETVKRMTLKPSSYDRLERTYELFIKEKIGNIPLKALTTADCQKLINEHVSDLSYSTTKKLYQLLKASCRYFFQTGDIAKNPMDLVVMPREAAFAKKTKEIIIPTEEEMKALLEAAECRLPNGKLLYNPVFVEAIKILSNTGMRIGELLALDPRQDISLEQATIRINKSVSEIKNRHSETDDHKIRRVVTDPKTKNGKRVLHVNSRAVEAIKTILELNHSRGFGDESLILNSRGNLASVHDIQRTLSVICKKAGIRHFSPHELRHYFASKCIANNMDILALSKYLGHANTTITLNTYAHLMDKQNASFIAALETI